MTEDTNTCRAAKLMAHLIFADLLVDIEPIQIEAFIKRRWERIAPLAHTLHEAPDATKAEINAAAPVEPTPMQKIKSLINEYGMANRELVRQDYGNRKPTADPDRVKHELLAALDELVKP